MLITNFYIAYKQTDRYVMLCCNFVGGRYRLQRNKKYGMCV